MTRTAPRATGQVGTVSAAIEILQAFGDDQPVRGVTDLAAELGMDKSRVHRILTTLHAGGLVQSVGASRKYALGPGLITLGERATRSALSSNGGQWILERLAQRAQESVVLCVADGLSYRTVASADGPSLLRMATELGRLFPGNLGATGHAIFAFHPDDRIANRLADTHDPDSPDAADRLVQVHQQVRAQGYAVTYGEFDPRVMAVAAPVRVAGQTVAALAAVGDPVLMSPRVDQLITMVRSAADDLEGTLHSHPQPSNPIDRGSHDN